MAKLLGSCICLTLGGIAPVDHKLHKLDKIGIGTVHDSNATCSDLTIDGCEAVEENVVKHKDSVRRERTCW